MLPTRGPTPSAGAARDSPRQSRKVWTPAARRTTARVARRRRPPRPQAAPWPGAGMGRLQDARPVVGAITNQLGRKGAGKTPK